ncbi:EGF domain-specific O-linked N-acetylglucosamine transferase [Hypsizygus marmoreus]|uniref:EGF domain-specific O-linked N-acetylglucosamine transferase n=1 Tax=Hypsizygus marmoreus TaxID=39966 RepID=A0A369JD78_HYPMA|nr:EGF domain-specific O-linked N-acetylglucosamine transferase [Hypsizygus marmoreus]
MAHFLRTRLRGFFALAAAVTCFLFLLRAHPSSLSNTQLKNTQGFFYREHIDKDQAADIQDTSTTKETTIPGITSVPGFTLLDRLYLRNGTFYVVTSDISSFPPRRNMITRPVDIGRGQNMEPTDEELRFLDPLKAKDILGNHAIPIVGMSIIVYDTGQFMAHFYHWWGEIILGAWRVYSTLAHPSRRSKPQTFATRFLLPHVQGSEWRDRAGVNAPLMRAAFPFASIEKADYWNDLITLDRTFVFENAMIIGREAARRHPLSGTWFKMIAGTMTVPAAEHFWEAIRDPTVTNVLGFLPTLNKHGAVIAPPEATSPKPIVTYISRQGAGRRLVAEDHEVLVKALRDLEAEGICEVVVAMMERMGLKEQIELTARSTVIVGVHGNGMTHQLWMPPSERSTVIEIFTPGGYVFDYEMLARNIGHRHYAVWNDTLITYPKGTHYQGIQYGDGFHGNSIPVYGPAVADVIRGRLRP